MRTTDATRYARWSALAALLLAIAVAGVYSHRAWKAYRAKQNAPPPVPTTVQQQSAQFTFSKVEQDRTLFTVRASRATEFKGGQSSLLEDVWITVFGPREQRFDNIHTRSCDYAPETGLIVCSGEVRIDLESAEEARERPGQRVIQVATTHVSFDSKTGEAQTDQPVAVRTPEGEGRAVGLSLSSRHGLLRLLRDVQLTLTTALPGQPSPTASEPLVLTGGSLEFRRADLTIRLNSPVNARQNGRTLESSTLSIELDRHLRARRAVADGSPRIHSSGTEGAVEFSAQRLTASFSPSGLLEGVVAEGSVRGSQRPGKSSGSKDEAQLVADHAELVMQPGKSVGRSFLLNGNVALEQVRGADFQRLETPQLKLEFAPSATPTAWQLERGDMPASARLELRNAAQSTQLRAQRLTALFGPQGQIRELQGQSGVDVLRRIVGGADLSATSRGLLVRFAPGGEWTEMRQTGSVRARQGDRTAQADRSQMVRATETASLEGSVILTDPFARTSADRASFDQRTGDVRAEGGVRTTFLRVDAGGAPTLGSQPAHLSSDRLLGNSNSGRATYSGHARLWQGDATVEAETIELVQQGAQQGQLIARGNVLAAFPQVGGPTGAQSHAAGPDLMRVRAGSLVYSSADRRAHLEQNVSAQSLQGQISARIVDLYFSEGGSGVRQVSRAVASGNIVVRQGDRRGTSDQAEFTASEGRFVLFGGRPTIYDASRGTTTGRQLTFFFADDRIVIDSEQGSRTLTRYRVEK